MAFSLLEGYSWLSPILDDGCKVIQPLVNTHAPGYDIGVCCDRAILIGSGLLPFRVEGLPLVSGTMGNLGRVIELQLAQMALCGSALHQRRSSCRQSE